jgi:hypothetical protein
MNPTARRRAIYNTTRESSRYGVPGEGATRRPKTLFCASKNCLAQASFDNPARGFIYWCAKHGAK